MIDLRQTKEYLQYMNAIGWKTQRIKNTNYFIKEIPLLGSVLKIQRPEKIDLHEIQKLERTYRVFQTIIEPQTIAETELLISHKFKQIDSPYLPSKTIHIDVTKHEQELLKEMHYKTRYNIRSSLKSKKTAKKHNIQIETSSDIKTFAHLWQIEANERGFFLSQEKELQELYKSFGENATIIVADSSSLRANETSTAISKKNNSLIEIASSPAPRNDIVAGVLLLFTKDICYYMYAFSTKEGKQSFAPTLLVWEALQIAKKRKATVFDFEGIFDERFPLPRWIGFSRFKKSFGGREIEYPGAFVKWRLPLS